MVSPLSLENLYPQIKYCWENGISLHKLYDSPGNHNTNISRLDPFHLVTSLKIEMDERGENLFWS